MLFQCCQDSRVINIPTKLYFTISDDELLRLCTESTGFEISNPFFSSYLETDGKETTIEEEELIQEQEYEEDENEIIADLNLPQGFWE